MLAPVETSSFKFAPESLKVGEILVGPIIARNQFLPYVCRRVCCTVTVCRCSCRALVLVSLYNRHVVSRPLFAPKNCSTLIHMWAVAQRHRELHPSPEQVALVVNPLVVEHCASD